MNTPQKDSVENNNLPDIPPEYRDGIWVTLDGGEVDRTVRPSQIPKYLLRNGAAGPEAEEDVVDSLPPPPESAIAPGPDLRDWLSRKFD
jgi:hypothetical protein